MVVTWSQNYEAKLWVLLPFLPSNAQLGCMLASSQLKIKIIAPLTSELRGKAGLAASAASNTLGYLINVLLELIWM